ncbi:MAG: trehalose-phosphatase [Actinomycetota bacterium]|nr:trehalose-phosphatase [Actinomycetota bacterium]
MVTDFDGTIAPIVGDPGAARPLPGALDALHDLAHRYATVAVVSGRPASFLVQVLGIGDGRSALVAYGSYGAERIDPDGSVTAPAPDAGAEAAVARAADDLEARSGPGVEVERKRWSVAVHWRNAPRLAAASAGIASHVATSAGLDLREARMAVELVLPGAPDKGSAVGALCEGAHAACYLGDDSGDLPAFAALAALRRDRCAYTASIAVASDEVPERLVAAADLLLDGPGAAVAFLAALAHASPRD